MSRWMIEESARLAEVATGYEERARHQAYIAAYLREEAERIEHGWYDPDELPSFEQVVQDAMNAYAGGAR